MSPKSKLSLQEQKGIKKLLDNKQHLAGVIDVLDLELGRASKTKTHTKKYLNKRTLSPFEIIIHKN
jgi:hypothetical protein